MKHYVVRVTSQVGEQEFGTAFLFSTDGDIKTDIDQCLANFYDIGEGPDDDDEEAYEEYTDSCITKIDGGYSFELAYDVTVDVTLDDYNEVTPEEYAVLSKHLHDLGTGTPKSL